MRKSQSELPLRWKLVHLAGLCAFALTEPIYRLIADNPQLLAAHGAGPWQLALLVCVLSLLVPLALAGIELLARAFGKGAHELAHSILVGLLVSLFAVQTAMRLLPAGTGGLLVPTFALASGAAFVLLYRRSSGVRSFTSLLAVLAIVSPILFLFDSRIREFLRPSSLPEPTRVVVADPAPLVILIFDELPLSALLDDRLQVDAALFPSFARVAGTSHWFRNATTTGGYTDLAVPSLHTGRYTVPDRLRPATLENYPQNLFTLFGATYQVRAMESMTNLSPALDRLGAARSSRHGDPLLLLADVGAIALHVVTPPPWNARLPSLEVGWAGFWRSEDDADEGEGPAVPQDRVSEIRAFLGGLEPGPRPPFVYLHILLPHVPWEYLPSGRRYYDATVMPGLLGGKVWSEDEWLTALAYQRIRLQIQAVDRMLGETLDRLDELGWLDRAMLVVTSDHGTSFTPGAPRRNFEPAHAEILRSEIMPIPLFVKLPDQHDGAVHDERAEIVDLLPSIAKTLGVQVPWPMDGVSLFEPRPAARSKQVRIQLRVPFVTVFVDEPSTSSLEILVKRRNRWFATTAAGGSDLFRFGPDADALGLDTRNAAPGAAAQRAVIHGENLFRGVESGQSRVPAFVTGEIAPLSGSPALSPGTPLAIGVDGVVRATARAYVTPQGAVAFAAVLPEDAIHDGAHRVELFTIERDGSAPVLTRIETRGQQETIQRAWESSRQTLFRADATTGWAGFQGSLYTQIASGEGGALEIRAPSGGVPLLELPAFEAGNAGAFVVAIETESDTELTPSLRYMTAADPVFRPQRFVKGRMRAGHDTVFLAIEDEGLLGRLALDLGRTRGRVLVRSIEVRGTGG